MKKHVVYVFLDSRTEDAAVALDPIKYEGIDDWYQVGEVTTMSELLWLLEDNVFDFEYFTDFMEEMPREIYNLLNQE